MLVRTSIGVALLLLAALHHRYWWVVHRSRRWREGDELRSGRVRDVNDFMLKWRATLALLLAGWLCLASVAW